MYLEHETKRATTWCQTCYGQNNIMWTLLRTIENLHDFTMLLCYAHTYASMWLWMKTDSKNWKKYWKLSKSLNFLNVIWDLWTIWKSGSRESSQFSSLLSSEAPLYVKQKKEKHFHVNGRSFIHPSKSKEALSIWAKWLKNFKSSRPKVHVTSKFGLLAKLYS